MNSFVTDCKLAIKELNEVIAIFERQEEMMDKLEKIGLTIEQKQKFAEIFYAKEE